MLFDKIVNYLNGYIANMTDLFWNSGVNKQVLLHCLFIRIFYDGTIVVVYVLFFKVETCTKYLSLNMLTIYWYMLYQTYMVFKLIIFEITICYP